MDNKIDQLKTEVNEIKDSLNALKNNVSLSESEKKTQAEALKSQAEATKHKIENEITSLESKTDDESKKKKEEAETLLSSFNATMSLYESIINTKSTNVPTVTSQPENENKGAFGKAKDWVGEQWDDVWDKEKWEKEGGKNLLRTAGFVATGVGAIALTVKGIKKLFGKDKKKEKDSDSKESKDKKEEKKPWWKKFLIGTGIAAGTVFGGVELYKNWNVISSWVKEKLGLALTFDEAMYTVESEVRNGIIKDDNFGSFCAHFEGISYDENTQEISSFGQKTKIDKKSKKIEGMDVQFRSREELFHAVNIVNFAKEELRGRGKNNTPFTRNKDTGDIDFTLSESGKKEFMNASGSNFWTWMLGLGGAGGGGLLGGYFLGLRGGLAGAVGGGLAGYAIGSLIDNTSTMGRACGTIAKGTNLDKFIKYLNEQNIRGEQKELYEPDDTTPIHECLNKVKHEIDDAFGDEDSARRDLKIEWDENNSEMYILKSYDQEVPIRLEGCMAKKGEKIDFSKIKKISLGNYTKKMNSEKEEYWGNGLNIDFPHNNQGLEEAIRVANLTNKIRKDRSGRGAESYPFAYGKYKTPFALEIDTPGSGSNHIGGTTILNNDTLKNKYPTLHKDLKKFPSTQSAVAGITASRKFQKKMHEQAQQNSPDGSQYIKYLHQMGKGKKRKK